MSTISYSILNPGLDVCLQGRPSMNGLKGEKGDPGGLGLQVSAPGDDGMPEVLQLALAMACRIALALCRGQPPPHGEEAPHRFNE